MNIINKPADPEIKENIIKDDVPVLDASIKDDIPVLDSSLKETIPNSKDKKLEIDEKIAEDKKDSNNKNDDELQKINKEVKEHNKKVITKDIKSDEKTKKVSFLHHVKVLNIVLSIRHLAVMLKSGLAIEDALKTLGEQANDLKLREVYKEIEADIHKGSNLSESMSRHPKIFSQVICSLISAGEQGGSLEKNLVFLAEYLKKDYELKKKIKGALFYPIMVFGITILEAGGVVFFILPKLESLFNSFKNVSPFTLFIINGSKFLRDNLLFIVPSLAVILFAVYMFLRTKLGKKFKDRLALSFPVIKVLTKNSLLTTFSRTLGILLESGIPLTNAMQISAKTIGNGIYIKVLTKVSDDVKSGKNLADAMALHPKFFPPTFVKMVEVGEQTGTLEENLLYLHEFYAEDVEDMTNNLTTLLEPLLLVFIGAMIGLLAISIVGPIYQLTSSIND